MSSFMSSLFGASKDAHFSSHAETLEALYVAFCNDPEDNVGRGRVQDIRLSLPMRCSGQKFQIERLEAGKKAGGPGNAMTLYARTHLRRFR